MTMIPANRDGQSGSGGWGVALAIAAAILAFYLLLAPRTTLWDRDEPRFAQAAVEMVDSGNALFPTFNGELRAHKPILIYWLMALSVGWFGAGELAVRCWSAVGVALACLFTFAVGRRLFSARSGVLAMLILATSPLVAVEAIAATTDAVLLAAITGAMAAFTVILERGVGSFWWALPALTVALAVAQLTKGPVGLVVPLLVMVVTWWLAGRAGERPQWIGLAIAAAAVLSVAVFAAWALPCNIATGGRMLGEGLGYHVLRRMLTPFEGHGGHPLAYLPFYLPVVAIGFLPWVVHLPGSVHGLVSASLGGDRARRLLIPWIVIPFLGFSIVATKLPHYVLPIWPALALTVAGGLEAARQRVLGERTMRCMRRGVWLYASAAGLSIAFAVVVALLAPVPGLRSPMVVLAAALAGVTVYAMHRQLHGRPWESTTVLVGAMLVSQAVAGLWLAPLVDRCKPVPPLAEAIRATTDGDVPVATFGFAEPSLVFYVGRIPVVELFSLEEAAAWARGEDPGVLVIPASALEDLRTRHGPLALDEIAASSGLNISKGESVELVALTRRAP